MRPLLDDENAELKQVLEQLLSDDADVTAREIARRHSTLRNASAFTRNVHRKALIEAAQQRQRDARSVRELPVSRQTTSAAETLARRTEETAVLQRQVQSLVASHAACIKAVVSHGGMAALERFWGEYKAIGDAVRELAAPVPGTVLHLVSAPLGTPDDGGLGPN